MTAGLERPTDGASLHRPVDSADLDEDVVVDQVMAEVDAQLRRTKRTPVDASRLRLLVEQEWASYSGARIRTFLPVLVRRAVIGQLQHD